MLRLAHRIVTTPPRHLVPWSQDMPTPLRQHFITNAANFSSLVANSEAIIIDNVAEYYALKDQDEFDLADFACHMPPFDQCFFEWNDPRLWMIQGQQVDRHLVAGATQRGVACGVVPAREGLLDGLFRHASAMGFSCKDAEEKSKQADLFVFMEQCAWIGNSGTTFWGGLMTVAMLDKQRRCYCYVQMPENPLQLKVYQMDNGATWREPIFIAWLAMSFLSCKNVARRDATTIDGPSEKWIRRQKAPAIRYHVLDINPMKEVLRTEGGIESNGLKKAMHICRGHFATYAPEKPLFGKVTGTFWVPAHVRGSVENGIVDKDYRVMARTK